MGDIEFKARKKRKNSNLQQVILSSIATIGVVSIALIAPNALSMLKLFGFSPGKRYSERITRARNHLIDKGFLIKDKQGFVKLTPSGEAKLLKFEGRKMPEKPKHWDKRWRVLIFDIPEENRSTRVMLRQTLINAGFVRLQDSVWVYPYDCEEFVALIKVDYKINKEMLYLIVEEMEGDTSLKAYFGFLD